ncbi:MAG TPA: AtpZ/AtpI family protein [Candidatus Binataceae bacterium]|nr:AtpZ/AtpI family protein [Candidatus Binataceae bacterium]
MHDPKDAGLSDDDKRKLEKAVDRMKTRREYWERTGEWPMGRALGMMGRFGWTIVGPPLLGALIGRWLDRTFHSGVFWSATLVFLGVVAGFYMVWQRMHAE